MMWTTHPVFNGGSRKGWAPREATAGIALPLLLLCWEWWGAPLPALALELGCIASTRCAWDSASNSFSISCFEADPGMVTSGDSLFFHGSITFQLKLHPGYSGGTITAVYLADTGSSSNSDPQHGEIDMEFYGGDNSSRTMVATNVFTGGQQNLEQAYLPFDPSAQAHTYTIQWNTAFIAWFADGTPLRVLRRDPDHPWPEQPLQLRASVWDSSWFTTLQANYSDGPIASQLKVDPSTAGCVSHLGDSAPSCATWINPSLPWNKPLTIAELQANQDFRSQHLVNSFGWDSA